MQKVLHKIKNILTVPEKKQLVFLGAGTVLLSLLETFSIALVLPLMTLFILPQKIDSMPALRSLYRACGSPDVFLFVALLIGGGCATLLARSAYSIWIFYKRQNILSSIYSRLTFRVLWSYLKKPYSFHLVNNSSELFKNTLSEVNNCVNYLLGSIISIASEIIILFGICLFLICAYPVLTTVIFVIFGLSSFLINALFRRRIRSYAVQREFYSATQYKNAFESLGAVKEVQIYDKYDYFASKYFECTESFMNTVVKFNIVSCLPKHIFETGFVVMALLAALFAVYLHKSFVEFIPVMAVFAVAMMRLSASFSKIYENVASFHFGGNSLNIISDVVKEADSFNSNSVLLMAGARSQHNNISLKEVSFRYQTAAHPIFEGLNISFPLHRISAIAGETGSGKSTVIDMIVGLLDPQKGGLFYCGLPINRGNMSEYRNKLGYVPQHIFLLDGSIAANVAFGVEQKNMDTGRIQHALKVAQLEPFINSLPEGINTKVGERGVRISGGQRQRIGIARALYRNPEILILDEASSALDSRTEEDLYEALKNFNNNITIILVTHRLATLEHADLIYVLERGKIADSGNYKELLLRSGVFRRMSNKSIMAEENA